eukprot:scaffold5857_cov81-Isochrysis_galbana.AAC.1
MLCCGGHKGAALGGEGEVPLPHCSSLSSRCPWVTALVPIHGAPGPQHSCLFTEPLALVPIHGAPGSQHSCLFTKPLGHSTRAYSPVLPDLSALGACAFSFYAWLVCLFPACMVRAPIPGDAGAYLCQGEVAVALRVELLEEFLPQSLGSLVCPRRQRCRQPSPELDLGAWWRGGGVKGEYRLGR